MPISPSDSLIFGSLYGDPQVAAEFSDTRLVEQVLEVETALAEVESKLGLIPKESAQQIVAAAKGFKPDWERLAAATAVDAFPVNELVTQLRASLKPPADSYLHWGATTQDIYDTAQVLQIRACLAAQSEALNSLIAALSMLAKEHRNTLMAGRTHTQQALPITFGFKVAGWLAPLLRNRERLTQLKSRLLLVQFGGGVGTLSVLGQRGPEVAAALAKALDLGLPPMPWHSQRDGIVELGGWLSLLTGSLGKMAQDIVLMAQSEIGELSEGVGGRSSTMPQKHNPIQSELLLGAARHNNALLASLHQAMLVEQERGTTHWQVEILTLPQMLALTSASLQRALSLVQNLEVHAERMRQNIESHHHLIMAEALSIALAAHMSRAEAAALVKKASRIAVKEDRPLPEVVRSQVNSDLDWEALSDPARHLGAAQSFIDGVLQQALEPHES